MKIDGHLHTPFCPHGSKDSLEQYVERAIELEFKKITFTEHAPLPERFVDPTPLHDSAMRRQDLDEYIRRIEEIKGRYRDDIIIQTGLEVDFIEGFEEPITAFLDEYGTYLDDSILSVHFLKKGNSYYCLDYSDDMFAEIAQVFHSVENVYEAYFAAVLRSIQTNLGKHKPKRIGHMTLVHKFQHRFPCNEKFQNVIHHILDEISLHSLELDYNAAGLFKPLCREPYPSPWIVEEAKKKKIPLVYGSDAHCAKDLGQGYDKIFKSL